MIRNTENPIAEWKKSIDIFFFDSEVAACTTKGADWHLNWRPRLLFLLLDARHTPLCGSRGGKMRDDMEMPTRKMAAVKIKSN